MHANSADQRRDRVARGHVRESDRADRARPCVPATRATLRRKRLTGVGRAGEGDERGDDRPVVPLRGDGLADDDGQRGRQRGLHRLAGGQLAAVRGDHRPRPRPSSTTLEATAADPGRLPAKRVTTGSKASSSGLVVERVVAVRTVLQRCGRRARPASHCSTRPQQVCGGPREPSNPGHLRRGLLLQSVRPTGAPRRRAPPQGPQQPGGCRRRAAPGQLVLVPRQVDHRARLPRPWRSRCRRPTGAPARAAGLRERRAGRPAGRPSAARSPRAAPAASAAGAGDRPRPGSRARRASPRCPARARARSASTVRRRRTAGCRAAPSAAAAPPTLTRPRWHRPGTATAASGGCRKSAKKNPCQARKP